MQIVDYIVLGCGVYLIFKAYMMKKDGEIPEGVLIGRQQQISGNADIEGFIRAMYGKTITLGIVAVLAGALPIAARQMADVSFLALVSNAVFFVVLVIYAVLLKKAQKEYLER